MVWREVVFLGAYGQISNPYAGFTIWEIKNPWVFVYFTSTYAIGVSVSAMWWPKTHGFLHTLALQLRQGYQVLQCDCQKPMGFCIFRFTLPAAKSRYPAEGQNMVETWRFSVCWETRYHPFLAQSPFLCASWWRYDDDCDDDGGYDDDGDDKN